MGRERSERRNFKKLSVLGITNDRSATAPGSASDNCYKFGKFSLNKATNCEQSHRDPAGSANEAFLWSSAAPCRVGRGGNVRRNSTRSTAKLPKRHVNNQRALPLDDVDLLVIARVRPRRLAGHNL